MTKDSFITSIKHFESLQKRYQTTNNKKMCDIISNALQSMNLYFRIKDVIEEFYPTSAIQLEFWLDKNGCLSTKYIQGGVQPNDKDYE